MLAVAPVIRFERFAVDDAELAEPVHHLGHRRGAELLDTQLALQTDNRSCAPMRKTSGRWTYQRSAKTDARFDAPDFEGDAAPAEAHND
jgi:hypothetical protein